MFEEYGHDYSIAAQQVQGEGGGYRAHARVPPLQPPTGCSDFYVQFRGTQQATVASLQTGCAVDG